ncbi:MAG: hypothetical protein CMJ84_12110 [Planctomycetes bacterium]|nr:hypothetical protein [Planctomycetota bacterium]
MRVTATLVVSILAVLSLAGLAGQKPSPGGLPGADSAETQTRDSIKWVRNYSQALARARQSGKPIFLEFRCKP